MKPIIQRVLALSKHDDAPPSSTLEQRVLRDWRNRPEANESLPALRLAVLGACAILLLTCALSLPSLTGTPDPTIQLANSALLNGINP